MKQVNTARQFGISIAAKMLLKPAWVLPLDGNTFITKESLELILRGLVLRYTSSSYNFRAISMFRSLKCQEQLLTDNFSFVDYLTKLDSKNFSEQRTISEYLTKREAQIAISTEETNLLNLFRTDLSYGRSDRRNLLKKLKKRRSLPFRNCLNENWVRDSPLKDTIIDIKNCGCVIRLQYYPETKCDINNDSMNKTEKKMMLEMRPEVEWRVRENLRNSSVLNCVITRDSL